MKEVGGVAKNSNPIINNITMVIAKPSIPSIKFIEFIIATIINIVKICATILESSYIPTKPWRLSIIRPLSIIILAAMIWNINFSLKKNEEQVQTGNTSLMLWKINELIEYVSKYFTLKIGDIIFTGTPAGVGKVFANDQLKGYIEDQEIFSIKIK